MKKKRVLMLAWEYPPRIVGGLARVVYALSHQLHAANWEVHVVTSDHPGAPEYLNDDGVHVHRVKTQTDWTPDFNTGMYKLNIGIVPYAIKLHLDQPFDVVHAHDWMVGDAAWLLKATFGIPLVCTIHATEFGRMQGIHNDHQRYVDQSEWRLIYESTEVIVNSPRMVTELQQRWSVPADKIVVIPNGIDPSKLACDIDRQELRRKHHLPGGPLILLVGRMVREKGAHVLLQAAPAVLKQVRDATFLIAGTGYYLDDLRAMTASMGIDGAVRFFGHANDRDLAELYRMSDCLAVPSLYEPFGIVALEGMAARVPVVTSDRGGLIDINIHMQTGLTTYAEDPGSLAWAILQILQDASLAERLKQSAYEHVTTSYSWEAIAEKTIALYDRIGAVRPCVT